MPVSFGERYSAMTCPRISGGPGSARTRHTTFSSSTVCSDFTPDRSISSDQAGWSYRLGGFHATSSGSAFGRPPGSG